jgi:hypothetical protein
MVTVARASAVVVLPRPRARRRKVRARTLLCLDNVTRSSVDDRTFQQSGGPR